jgi:hypothetical protein
LSKSDTKKEFIIEKIWVCGPPIMSDNFDRDLQSLTVERDDEIYLAIKNANKKLFVKKKVQEGPKSFAPIKVDEANA